MLYINRTSTDPYFNIAAEEYMLKNFSEDCFMLWQNEPCIIVGKHQNTLAEINYDYVKDLGIPVVRRISGGGTVFHDLGNLNFTFIQNGKEEELVNFRKYTKPILEVLKTMGIDAMFEGRNDLTINGKKFSGNAEHVHKNRTLHHGTLLFSSTLPDLSKALKVDPLKFKDKAVKSVRSRVTNLREHMKEQISIEEFRNKIRDYVLNQYPDANYYELRGEDIEKINRLVEEKYGTWKWNFGYSPKYNFKKSVKSKGGYIEFNFDVKDGIIRQVKIFGDFFNSIDIEAFEKSLIGLPHEEKHLMEKIATMDIGKYFNQVAADELVKGMF